MLEAAEDFESEALLRTAISTGVRREDLVRIRMEGVDLEAGRIRFYESKKRRWHEVSVGGETLPALRKWVAGLPSSSTWLFPSSHGPVGRKSGHRVRSVGIQRPPASAQRGLPRTAPIPRSPGDVRQLCQRRGWSVEQVARLTGDSIRVVQLHYSTPSRAEMGQVAREKPLL